MIMVANRKGVAWMPIFILIAIIVVITGWLFFAFFKVHITSILVDVDSINRYQEIPTTVLAAVLRVPTQDELTISDNCKTFDDLLFKQECIGLKQFSGGVQKIQQGTGKEISINCFNGNGLAGPHKPNDELCTKIVAFYFAKYANGVGIPILSEETEKVFLGYSKVSAAPQLGDLKLFKNNLKASLPLSCYKVSFEEGVEDSLDTLKGCQGPKLNEIYTIPIFLNGNAKVAKQILRIDSSYTQTEKVLLTWPRYNTDFFFGGSGSSGGGG